MKALGRITLLVLVPLVITIAGCGGSSSTPSNQPKPIDPSGNWSMTLTDSGGNKLLLSGLFSQTGSVVSALNILAVGNSSQFTCVPFSASFANGQVLNVDQFSGDIDTQFGNIHFASTLNSAGTHADGTYALTGNCWGVAASGTFSADEIPSMSGNWSGTVNCTANCPTGATAGTITATLTQDDATGIISGTYAVAGLPNISSGNFQQTLTILGNASNLGVLSGSNFQDGMLDNNHNVYAIEGGPFAIGAGLALDRSFNGKIVELQDANAAPVATYSITMTH